MFFWSNPWRYYQQSQPSSMSTTVEQEPCPHCSGTDYICVSSTWICNSCRLSREAAIAKGLSKKLKRDAHGYPVCQSCGDSSPYAEVQGDEAFTCGVCKGWAK